VALLLPSALAILAQADFEEHQQHGSAQPGRDQHDREHLTRQPTDEGGARTAGEDERESRPEREDAYARGHGSKVHAHVDGTQSPAPGVAERCSQNASAVPRKSPVSSAE
jgi:hypothetical protein